MSGTQDQSDETLVTLASDEDRRALDKAWESPIFELFGMVAQHYKADEHVSALSRVSYAKDLRALGQVLERLSIESVDLKVDSGCYVVHGQVDKSKRGNLSFRLIVRNLASRLWSPRKEIVPRVSKGVLAARYSPKELEQLDLEYRANRRDPNKLPDPYGLSQRLRGAGFYLDRRSQSSLVGISIKDRWVTIRYETAWQQLEEAKQDVEYFYNYWVKMYLRRTSRDALVPKPSEPTYIATDQEAFGKTDFSR